MLKRLTCALVTWMDEDEEALVLDMLCPETQSASNFTGARLTKWCPPGCCVEETEEKMRSAPRALFGFHLL